MPSTDLETKHPPCVCCLFKSSSGFVCYFQSVPEHRLRNPSVMKIGIDINRQGRDESLSSVNRNSPKVFYELGVCLFCEIGSDGQIVIAVKELLEPFELTPS